MTDAPSLADLERDLRSLLFSAEPGEPGALAGVEPERRAVYRRIVRNNLFRTIRNTCPIARKLLGEQSFDRLVARFLDERPPTTRLYRELPLAFAAWLSSIDAAPHHPALPELVHFETVEVEVQQAPNPSGAPRAGLPDDDAGIEADPSARLLAYTHPVHLLARGAERFPSPTPEPTFLVAWRLEENMRWRQIPAVLAKVLALCGEGLSLGRALALLEEQHPGQVDRGRVRSLLVDLKHRGALLGFPRGGDA